MTTDPMIRRSFVTWVIEGRIYDAVLDSGQRCLLTDDGEFVYDLLPFAEGARVRVRVEVLDA